MYTYVFFQAIHTNHEHVDIEELVLKQAHAIQLMEERISVLESGDV